MTKRFRERRKNGKEQTEDACICRLGLDRLQTLAKPMSRNRPKVYECRRGCKLLKRMNRFSVCGFEGMWKDNARVAQLVEYNLAKVGVAGSSPVSRSQE